MRVTKTCLPQAGLTKYYILANNNNLVQSAEHSVQKLSLLDIEQIPAVMGEADVLKIMQYLPGVQAAAEVTANLSVRGGSHDQNFVMLDGAPVYNPTHALGLSSAFNPDALKSVKLYTGAFPAQYGGRVSSVVDMQMKEGNRKILAVSGGIGLIASRLTFEAPIIKNKCSFMISGRYSYAGQTVNAIAEIGQKLGRNNMQNFSSNNEINYYDLNVKANYKLNKNNHFYLSTYTGADHFYYYLIDSKTTLDWGNLTSSMRWNHIWGNKLFSNFTLLYSNYNYAQVQKEDVRNFEWLANLQEIDFKADFDYYFNTKNRIKFGFACENHFYEPGSIQPRVTYSITTPFSIDDKQSAILALYVQNQHKITDKIKLDYGIRYAMYAQIGAGKVYHYDENYNRIDSVYFANGEIMKSYSGIEPRISLRYLLNKRSSVKLAYSLSRQYQQLISNSSIGLPTNILLPADTYIKPITSHQTVAGFFMNDICFFNHLSLETYYKKNIIDYKDNADLNLNSNIETELLVGDGTSYGAELMLKKDVGKLTGWISYTLSKTTLQINGINNGNPYPARFNKRHNLSLLLKYNLGKQWSLSGTFKYTSGGYTNVPKGSFYYYGSSFTYYTTKNGYQLPDYHRLDIAINYSNNKNKDRRFKTDWSFGVYNISNRHNVFSISVKQNIGDLISNNAYKMYLYGAVPFINLKFKF